MAKTYEELEKLGWQNDVRTSYTWFHPETGVPFIRQVGEADAEFRERLERNTPGIENFDWVTALRRAKNRRSRLQAELDLLEKEIAKLTGKVREHSLWKITDMPEMSWGAMMKWATENLEIREIKIAQHDYRVSFYGLKSQGSPLLYVASRVGWPQDMEGDDE